VNDKVCLSFSRLWEEGKKMKKVFWLDGYEGPALGGYFIRNNLFEFITRLKESGEKPVAIAMDDSWNLEVLVAKGNEGMPKNKKSFEIWVEGYAATGECGTADLMGYGQGVDFCAACIAFFEDHKSKHLFDSEALTYWGCKLFDNQKDAQKMFG